MSDEAAEQRDLGAQLMASEARLRNIVERSPDAFVIVDGQGTVQFVNAAAVRMFGVSESDLIGQPFGFPVIGGEITEIDIVHAHGEALIAEMRVLDTEWDGKTAHVAVLRDITERNRAELALRASELRLNFAMAVAGLGYWDVDLHTGGVVHNDMLFSILGYLPGEIAPCSCLELIHPDDVRRVELAQKAHWSGQTSAFSIEMRMRTKTGTWRWVHARGEVLERDRHGKPLRFVGIAEDISARKETEERIRHASQHDPLTRLPNRELLYDFSGRVLASAMRGSRQCAFLFVDLDRFKPINDTYGHDVGDAVLKEVATRLRGCVRSEDIVGRLGGDEFLVVLAHVGSEADAAGVARHILRSLTLPYPLDGLVLALSPSIGISMFPLDGNTVEDLIRNADTAMYHAKDGGRSRFQFFKAAFNERMAQSLTIESRLRSGLEHRDFALFYQPILDTATMAVVGAEALLRWPDTPWGPDLFIPVAEAAGFMSSLGEWVVQEACRQQRDWRGKGVTEFPLSVNVSPSQFRNPGFVRHVANAIRQAGIHPGNLCIELTESTLIRDVDEAVAIIRALKDMGIKIALDDFGTGYSSLSYLSRLPIDVLKLDQSFVRSITHNQSSMVIAESVIVLGNSLALEVIAEGIESREDLDFLRSHQCRHGQGFYFCRPVTAPEFETWCQTRSPDPGPTRSGPRGA
ncbi:putative bifunctional diguanylate cyclase/phosphodiesterase [Pseudoduganella namucuonensis]|uniref:putative bifunctional diguanylate cyclase/phosphodiesterase n=1 Tax=Pseudoduganella namucuonensis TaxID=1035707 RepID=UPI0015A63D1D|nr:GGDEF and EAL domain-containing protein [Pseudoduganella namucuonensis]